MEAVTLGGSASSRGGAVALGVRLLGGPLPWEGMCLDAWVDRVQRGVMWRRSRLGNPSRIVGIFLK
jgi:hypothetical protein